MTFCPICGLSVLYRSGNQLICPKCRHMEAVKKSKEVDHNDTKGMA
jgi:uncharacterized Zn finger protein (UPF0148 family)